MQMNTIPIGVGSSTGTIGKKKDKGKKGKKQPLTKNDIGAPTNFQFVVAALFRIILLLVRVVVIFIACC